jgi:integrase
MMCAQVELLAVSQDQKWIDMWISEQESENTRLSYRRTINRLLALLNKPLPEITRHDLLMYRVQRTADGLCARSRNQELACVKSLFRYINKADIHQNYLKVDVSSTLKKEHVEPKRAFVPDIAQTRGMLDVEMPPLILCAMKVMIYTGCRVSEVGKIGWDDLEVGTTTVSVKIHGKGLKTHVSAIPLSLYRELREQCGDSDPLLPFSRDRLYYWVKKIGAASGMENVHPHSLRHACATYLVNADVPAYLVKEHLGHAKLETTLDYCDIKPDGRITDTMELILGGTK